MRTIPTLLPVLVFLLVAAASAADDGGDNSTFVPRDYILLDCGSSGQNNDSDGRQWNGDTGSKYAPSLNSAGVYASNQDSSVPSIRTSPPVFSPLRSPTPSPRHRTKVPPPLLLPSNYSGRAASDAFFDVNAGPITLLRNFSAYQTAQAINFAYLIQEFSINVASSGLSLTFTPSVNHSNSFAFINGIEIVSMPDIFSDIPTLVSGGTPTQYPIDENWAMQSMYRLNVGGQAISPKEDSGMYRSWADDSLYIYGAAFGTAQTGADVISWGNGIGRPVYKDYVTFTSGSGKMDLWISLHPDLESTPQYFDAILNGMEVFKLQDTKNNLAGLNPDLPPQEDVEPDKVLNKANGSKSHKTIGIVCGAGSAKTTTTGSYASSLPSNLCRHFSFAEIEAATGKFDEALLLGVGGFGKVYRGEIDDGTKVAIKRGNPMSEQGVHEFQTEIEMLSSSATATSSL
ncbi:hypothetical protein HPP92_001476 [Vanilla planifolia]|uniref:Protein kinase domain-containing protein n=1 Tax=Vanilla planifolia TaxID=51239 RepID=A0A835S4N2_VANPL|nr:hypothetical protein HPP92_001476 [Vanilla planifolia]